MDYSMYLKTNEDGTQSFDKVGFDKALQSEIDSAVSKGVETFKKSYEKKIESDKMTEREKFDAERKEFEEYRINAKKEIVSAKAKSRLEGKGFSENEITTLLNFVSDDEEASLKIIDTMVTERTKLLEDNNKKVLEQLQKQQPKVSTTSNTKAGEENKKPAKTWSKDEILKAYR